MGGEKYKVYVYNTVDKGSPPHGRGKVSGISAASIWPRITPAWAGKSDSPPVCGWVWEDHPRAGGEKCIATGLRVSDVGSPLRGRGKAFRVGLAGRILGITPA